MRLHRANAEKTGKSRNLARLPCMQIRRPDATDFC